VRFYCAEIDFLPFDWLILFHKYLSKESLQKNLEQTATKIVDLSNQLAFHEDNLSQFAHSLKLLSPHLHHIDFQNLNQVSEIIKDIIGTSEQEIYTLKQQLDNTNKNLKDSTEREKNLTMHSVSPVGLNTHFL
jgi:chromosome segregation ATPase